MYSDASNFVHGVDKAFYFILGISFFFLIGITATMIFFVIKYNRKKNKPAVQIKDNTLLEVTWTIIPLILVTFMFFYGYNGFTPMRSVPKDAMEIKVTGMMWKWIFDYPGNKQSDSLVVPLDKAVKLNLVSLDVIHGFYIPAFRIKEDVVPGKKNYTWFIAGKEGDYDLLCSAYCGVRHSYMSALVVVVPEAEFNKWLAALPERKPETSNEGLVVLQKTGCIGCHSLDGAKLVGPTFKGLYGSTINVETDGKPAKILVDSVYIKNSIIEPDKDVHVGYQKGIMKSYKDLLNDDDIRKINEYLEKLK